MAFDHVTLHILPSYLGNEYERLEVDVAPDVTVNDVLAAGREGALTDGRPSCP